MYWRSEWKYEDEERINSYCCPVVFDESAFILNDQDLQMFENNWWLTIICNTG